MKKFPWLIFLLLPLLYGACGDPEVVIEPIYFIHFDLADAHYEMEYLGTNQQLYSSGEPSWGWGSQIADSSSIAVTYRSSLQPDMGSSSGTLEIGFGKVVDDSEIFENQVGMRIIPEYSVFESIFADENLVPYTQASNDEGVFFMWRDHVLDNNNQPLRYLSYPTSNTASQFPNSEFFNIDVTLRERTTRGGFEDGILLEGDFSGMMYLQTGDQQLELRNGTFRLFFPKL